ncbi:hypothetical protein L2E82_30381 [Cichorium intybus]|uniref:Uncharacterized protein n=1 Tax=Cichorium intybus TaxID=13427 RepID=A0ACB9D080_CICIN|nr:hypothetical protein L2E82_30381 [Cichorium intybus]
MSVTLITFHQYWIENPYTVDRHPHGTGAYSHALEPPLPEAPSDELTDMECVDDDSASGELESDETSTNVSKSINDDTVDDTTNATQHVPQHASPPKFNIHICFPSSLLRL